MRLGAEFRHTRRNCPTASCQQSVQQRLHIFIQTGPDCRLQVRSTQVAGQVRRFLTDFPRQRSGGRKVPDRAKCNNEPRKKIVTRRRETRTKPQERTHRARWTARPRRSRRPTGEFLHRRSGNFLDHCPRRDCGANESGEPSLWQVGRQCRR